MGDTVKTVSNNFLNNSIVYAMLLFILHIICKKRVPDC